MINDTEFVQQFAIPQSLKTTTEKDKDKNFHKKLQNKLDSLIKKKDWQIIMDLTKRKIFNSHFAKGFKLPLSMPISGEIKRTISINLAENQEQKEAPKKLRQSILPFLKPSLDSFQHDQKEDREDSPFTPENQIIKQEVFKAPSDASGISEDDDELEKLLDKGYVHTKKDYYVCYKTGTKSILCRRLFKLGNCPNGKDCPYAHSKKELRFNSSQEWIERVQNLGSFDKSDQSLSLPSLMNSTQISQKYIGKSISNTGFKMLMEACRIDNHKGIELLIKNGANPIAQDFNGLDALYYCVRFSNLQSLKVLVSLAFDKIPIERTYEKKKRNILTIASLYSEDEQILKFLLKNDFLRFNTNQTDRYQRNAIFYSVFRNRVESVKSFIDADTSLDIPDLRGMLLLDYAQQCSYDLILLELIKGGARLGLKLCKGVEIMHYAANKGDYEIIRALIAKNVMLQALSEETGSNCIMTAMTGKQFDLVRKLIDFSIDIKPVNQQDRDFEETILMKAIQRNYIDIVKQVCNKTGIKIGNKDKLQKTEIIHACERNSLEIAKIIISTAKSTNQDLDLNCYDKKGRTALIYAVIQQNPDLVELILYCYPNDEFLHQVKWKDELGRDVCEYAKDKVVKALLVKYIKQNKMEYLNYYTMKSTLKREFLLQYIDSPHSSESPLLSPEPKHGEEQFNFEDEKEKAKEKEKILKRLNMFDRDLKKQVKIFQREQDRLNKHKLKRIEEQINKESDELKQDLQKIEVEKQEAINEVSKQRLKQLKIIAIKFPKIEIEQNVKFRQAIDLLYKESDLSHLIKPQNKLKTVENILQQNSPFQQILKRQNKRNATTKSSSKSLKKLQTQKRLPLIMSSDNLLQIAPKRHQKKTLNIKDGLKKIFTEQQFQMFQAKKFDKTLDKEIKIDPSARGQSSYVQNRFRTAEFDPNAESESSDSQVEYDREHKVFKTDKLQKLFVLPGKQSVRENVEAEILIRQYYAQKNLQDVKKEIEELFNQS